MEERPLRTPVFAANWKMNLGPRAAAEYMRTFLECFPRRDDRTVAFFLPALSFHAAADALRDRPEILLGVQNIHWEEKGAFTGESSAPIAREAGARLALVGHSERRHIFGERDEESGRKCEAAVRAGLVPVLCVGETLEERERGETESVVLRQLRAGIAPLDEHATATMLVAYEPVWAIGTGRTARPEDASTVHEVIRRELRARVGEPAARVPILYGGSVNTGNVASLLAARDMDGVLVGGASLDPRGWAAIAST
ncbi:MAG TPA: triose-phosphate isomerase [Gemmatimonadaceae bacterium]|nr:triose-phosphate isomerase [Gemmatimonadaceae bacterium]